jgi:amino acid transporter
VSDIAGAAKRLLLGRPVRSDRLARTLLPKRLALPAFASDALSSVAYAPDEIILTLSLAGVGASLVSPWVGLAVAVVLVVVVASYRQNVHAYPSGGGDYEVVTTNLGDRPGLAVGSALLVDYALTVAVSVSAAAQYATSALPALQGHAVPFALGLVALLVLANLRGGGSGRLLALPTYLFLAAVGALAVTGVVRMLTGELPQAASADLELLARPGLEQGLVGLGGALLVLRAFASGSVALTGVETISNGVPSFRPPKRKNAATTLSILGACSVVFLTAILWLARATGVKFVDEPGTWLLRDGVPVGDDYVQHPVLGQIADAVFDGAPVAFVVVTVAAALILVAAANAAFTGFPVLGSILARDGYLPRQLHTRGDRLAFSNGILTLAAGAGVLIWMFDAQVTRLIHLYVVGVFVSFTLSQLGMVRHWNTRLRTEPDSPARRAMLRRRAVNTVGLVLTATVLVVVLASKFRHGAWIAVLAMIGVYVGMAGIKRHYDQVADELSLGEDPASSRALPSRVHAIVLLARLHKPAMRAIAYARATRPSVLEAVTVDVEPAATEQLQRQWESLDVPVPLRVLDSPFREITRPVLEYVKSIRRESPRDLVVVFVPEYVVGHWWERLLHNQSTMRLKTKLRFTPGVVVANVPWQLQSTAAVYARAGHPVPTDGAQRPAGPTNGATP